MIVGGFRRAIVQIKLLATIAAFCAGPSDWLLESVHHSWRERNERKKHGDIPIMMLATLLWCARFNTILYTLVNYIIMVYYAYKLTHTYIYIYEYILRTH